MTPIKTVLPNRQQRRQMVVACYGSAAGALLLGLLKQLGLPHSLDLAASLLAAAALITSFFYMLRLLNPKLLGTSDGPDYDLDERQLHIRNQAYLNAYRILASLAVLGLTVASVFWNNLRQIDDSIALSAFFWLVILLVISLPAALLAWLEPDPIQE